MDTKQKKSSKKAKWIILVCLLLVLAIAGTVVAMVLKNLAPDGRLANDAQLVRLLAKEGDATITLDKDILVDEPLVVNGNKTIEGSGSIILITDFEAAWPKDKNSSWGVGCTELKAEEAEKLPALFNIGDGASLTLGGDVTVDTEKRANGVLVGKNGSFTITGNAVVKNGRYANLVVEENATALLAGGELLDGGAYNVINNGNMELTGTNVSGAETGATVYTLGTVTQSGGTVANGSVHNVYVAAGSFTMTGGTNTGAKADGILVAAGATADVTGGSIADCNHGLCNKGTLNAKDVTLTGCGVMNYNSGVMDLLNVTSDTSDAYSLTNSGGKLRAENFTSLKCDTCAIYNFSGEMELINISVSGSRDGNIACVSGTVTINGGTLGICRDKSVTVGGGVLRLNDVAVEGTSKEKYGLYAYGGELYMTGGSIADVNSTAVKADAGSYVELSDVSISGIAQNGLQTEGGQIKATNVTMKDLGSHGVYNNGGTVEATGLVIDTVEKNGVQHKAGTTTITGFTLSNTGNHGAYVENGTLTITDGTLDTMAANGFYLPDGDSKLVLTDVEISNTVQQGINNEADVVLTNVTITDTGMNGIYNKVGGTATIDGLTVKDAAEHGVNNKADMTISNVVIINTGADSNGIQNNGTMVLMKASITNSKNHGIYNNGKLTAVDVTIDTTADNGVYNDKGDATFTGLTVKNTTGQGVNNNYTITLTDVTISNTGKNGIYNSDGVATVKNLKVSSTKEHGINNAAEMTVEKAAVSSTGVDKNGIQNSGKLTLNDCQVSNSKNHGIYNIGTLSGVNVTVSDTRKNGIYNYDGTVDTIEGLNITKTGEQGVNNTGSFTATDVTISGTGKNGIYNVGGTLTVNRLTVTDPGEHGVSNDSGSTAVLTEVVLTGSADGSNCIQNKGNMTVTDLTAADSGNHGIYNDAVFTANGSLVIKGAAVNGLYNYGGTVDIASLEIQGTLGGTADSHGVNNDGTMTVGTLTITGSFANGIQNKGELTITGSALITDAGKHGVYNGGTLEGVKVTITNAGDLLVSNAGDMIVHGMVLTGTAHKALYNNGYAELYNVTIDGTDVTNGGSAEYLVDNNGGVLDLTDATLVNANGTALHNRGKAVTSVTNVIIDGAGNYGIFIEGGSKLSGDGLVVNNVTKNTQVSGAEGYAIKNQGTVTMLDHVTLGAYDDEVTGDGVTPRKETSGIASTALTNDAASSIYSGYDLVIKNALGGNAIYNKGTLYVTDLTVDSVKDGIVNRYNSWATLSGTVSITNVTRNPVSNYGAEGGNYVNGLTLTAGSTMSIENCGSHAINNKGSFLAAADTVLVIKNVIGQNINAINNNTGTMELGNVVIDGVYVTVSMYNDTTINSNSGNGIQTSGSLILNGDAVISNIYISAANGMTDNSNGSGVVVKNGGKITGTGSITIVGNQTAPEGYEGYTGLFNGIYITKCTLDIDGDITLSGAKNQGIYVADANAYLGAGNITVSKISGNGIYMNNASGKIEAKDITVDTTGNHGLQILGKLYAENITISNVSGSNQGLYVRDGGAYVEAASVTISDITGGNGIYVNNASGKLIVSGAIRIENTAQHGLSSKGTVEADSVTIKNVGTAGAYNGIENTGTVKVTGSITVHNTTKRGVNSTGIITADSLTIDGFKENGIQNGGTITVTGAISISNGIGNGHGVYSSKKLTAGSFFVNNVKRNGINNAGEFVVAGEVSIKNAVQGGIGSNKTFSAGSVTIDTVTAGPGINNSGTFTVTGLTSVKNITGTAVNAIQNKGTMTLGDVTVDGVYVVVGDDADGNQNTFVGNGLYNGKTLILNGTAAITNVFTDEKNNSIGAGFAQASTGTTTGTGSLIITGTASTNEAYPYGINNGIFLDGSSIDISGDITVSNVTNQGIYVANANAFLTAKNITVTRAGGNGIYQNNADGGLTATGDIVISNVTGGHGLSTSGAVGAASITISNVTGGTRNGMEVKSGSVTASGTISISKVTQYGINNVASVTAGAITIDTAGSNGINNNKGTLNVSGAITVTNVAGHGVSNNYILNAASVTVTNVAGSGNGIQNSGSGVMTITGAVVVDQVSAGHGIYNGMTVSFGTFTASNTAKNGINNGGTMIVTGAITVTKAGADGVANGGGKTLEAGSITVTDLSGTDGTAVKNSGTMTVGDLTIKDINITITKDECGNALMNKGTLTLNGDVLIQNISTPINTNDTKCNGIYNVGGTITSDKQITITIDTVKRTGVYLNGGSITGSQISLVVKNTEKTLIRLLGGATIDVLAVVADTGKDQGIQLDDANTLKAQVVAVKNVPQNGLRLKNASAEPTVQIGVLICMDCANYALASNNNIVSDNVTVGTLYHSNCKNVIHGKIQSGVVGAAVDLTTLSDEQIAALAAQLPERVRNVLFPTAAEDPSAAGNAN